MTVPRYHDYSPLPDTGVKGRYRDKRASITTKVRGWIEGRVEMRTPKGDWYFEVAPDGLVHGSFLGTQYLKSITRSCERRSDEQVLRQSEKWGLEVIPVDTQGNYETVTQSDQTLSRRREIRVPGRNGRILAISTHERTCLVLGGEIVITRNENQMKGRKVLRASRRDEFLEKQGLCLVQ